MSYIRGLELLFNLEHNNFKSKEDCLVAVLHSLLINENLQCAGTGETWPVSDSDTSELLPKDWNSNENEYCLRYTSKEKETTRILLKVIKMEHILQVHVVQNEVAVEAMAVPVGNYVSDQYNEYSTAYKDLESLAEPFRKDVVEKLKSKPTREASTSTSKENIPRVSPPSPPNLPVPPFDPRSPFINPNSDRDRILDPRFRIPPVGGSDLNPFVSGGGGMLMDPSSFGTPQRNSRDPSGLPSGVPPGARYDPFGPPVLPSNFEPNPDHLKRPDSDDDEDPGYYI